jgi:phytanoyl-CoA hydroxylase
MAEVETDLYSLTEEERQTYAEDGFFIRPTMFGADEMDALSGRIADLVHLMESSDVLSEEQKNLVLKRNESAGEKTGPASLNSLYRIHTFSAMVREHMRDPRRLAAVTEIVGPDLFCPNDLYFLKPPGTGRPIAWHQDSWYFSNTYVSSVGDSIEEASIGTWLALDDADEENGCLWVIPGSHRLGVVEHEDVESDGYLLQKRGVVTDEMEKQGIPVEVPKGALVFFNNALLHRSTPNVSDRFRRAYIVHYMKGTIQPTERNQNRKVNLAAQNWGSQEAHICGRLYPDCVQTTPEENCMDWDKALGRTLTEEEIRVKEVLQMK